MKRWSLSVIALMLVCIANAQYFCATDESRYEDRLSNRGLSFVQYEGPYYVRVFFHIIKKEDGTGEYSFPESELPSCMQMLNSAFAAHNIYFDYAGMDYIYNTLYYNMSSMNLLSYTHLYDSVINTNVHDDAIDVYLFRTNTEMGGKACGIPARALIIGGQGNDGIYYASSHVLSHEMGHCLGLYHTFHGGISEQSNGCAELVNGSNCTICGDFVCDTPADPFPLFEHIDSTTCLWFNDNYKDANGHLYNPDTKQIMAYVPPSCMTHFSDGQGDRMRAHIATEQILQDRTTPTIVYIQNQTFFGNSIDVLTARDSIVAGHHITTGNTGDVIVLSGADVTFEAGDGIILKPGFRVNQGAKFQAIVRNMIYPNEVASRHDEQNNTYLPLLENTLWTHVACYFESPITASFYQNIKDTLIEGKNYTFVKMSVADVENAVVYPDNNPSITHMYFYEDVANRRVFKYDPFEKIDVLWYDFSLQVGDTLPGNRNYILNEISPIENTGYTRNQYTFVHGSDSIVWIEGIGNYTDFLSPNALKRHNKSRILCVRKNDETVYETGKFLDFFSCDDINNMFQENIETEIDRPYIGSSSASKIIRDGQIFILRGDKTYTLQGQEVK